MKEWYYTVTLPNGKELTNEWGIKEGIDYVVRRAISHILYETSLESKARLIINLFDYPPSSKGKFGQAIHMFEFNILK